MVQVLNDSNRAILFEWTHTAISQEAFVRIGASLRLKPKSSRTEQEWIAFSRKHLGPEAGFSWLYVGCPESRIEQLLGPPREKKKDQIVYVNEWKEEGGKGRRATFRFPMKDGKLTRLSEGWSSSEELPAPRGTKDWIAQSLKK